MKIAAAISFFIVVTDCSTTSVVHVSEEMCKANNQACYQVEDGKVLRIK